MIDFSGQDERRRRWHETADVLGREVLESRSERAEQLGERCGLGTHV